MMTECIIIGIILGGYVVSKISDKVINIIKDKTSEIPESICSSDLAIFKPRQFDERENRFDFYHFVIPQMDVPAFLQIIKR